jgi:serine protease AprX
MRYSIVGVSIEQIKAVGGFNIKEARSVGVIFADLSADQVARLKAAGARVNPIGAVKTAVSPPITPPAPAIAVPRYTAQSLIRATGFDKARAMFVPQLYGSGFNIALIDSGVRETHQLIAGHVVFSKNYTDSIMRDGFNHGTGVAGIILSVAPLCGILNMKILDDKGQGTEESLVLAIDDCISLWDTNPEVAPSVINLSVGMEDSGDPSEPARVACRAAIAKGIWVIAAAGNSGPAAETIMSPACEKYVFAVGCMSYDPLTLSSFSSRGPTVEGLVKPDVVFFGQDIIVASSVDDTATKPNIGTSFSTPFCSGIALLYREGAFRHVSYQPGAIPSYPEGGVIGEGVSAEELMDTYLQRICAKPEGAPAVKDSGYGYGLPMASLVLEEFGIRQTQAPSITSMAMATVGIGMFGSVGALVGKE